MCCLLTFVVFLNLAAEEKDTEVMKYLCPTNNEINDWQPDGESETAIGQDLYLLINGGAEIYHEYGFKQAIHQSFINSTGHRINLEIYKMESPESAYGIFTFRTSETGIPVEYGQKGWLETYFLNFWRENYLITVIGLDEDSTTIHGIKKIGRVVDNKIKSEVKLPQIISLLPKQNLLENETTYLKGNLALYNQDLFGPKDIFGLREGVLGKYPNYSILIFQYENPAESEKWFENSKWDLKQNTNFTDFSEKDSGFTIKNTTQNQFFLMNYQKWIVIVVWKGNIDLQYILTSIKQKFD